MDTVSGTVPDELPSPGPIRVLHVDDDPDLADLTATYLEREFDDLTVETAQSGREALDLLADAGTEGRRGPRTAGGDGSGNGDWSDDGDGGRAEDADRDRDGIACVVSDYDMPGLTGLELLERVRADHPGLPFILFTGKGSEEIASRAITAGVTDYLQKGTGPDQYTVLANRIENAVERYRSRRALERSQERLSLFIDRSPLGVIEWDGSFEFVRMNDAAAGILGYDDVDLDGRSWPDLVPEADRDLVRETVADLRRDAGGYHSFTRTVRGDGEIVVCEWHSRVITGPDGDAVAAFSQFQDITDRATRERALRRERDRFSELFDSLPVAVVHAAFEGEGDGPVVRRANPRFEALFGYDADAVAGRPLADFVVPPDRRESFRSLVDRLHEAGRVRDRAVRRTVDGPRTLCVEMCVLDADAPTPEGYVIYDEPDADRSPP